MARAQGARAQMALAFETTYGTAPTTGFRVVPFASTTLGSEQPLITSELLGQGRDPLAPIKDAVTADGDVVVPLDVENFGLWLKAAFGAPTTTGTTPKTHTFQSGNWLQVCRQLAKPRFLALGKGFVFGHRAFGEQVAAHVDVGLAADMGFELGFAECTPVFLQQELLNGLQVQGIGVGEGAIEVEEQGSEHGAIPLAEAVKRVGNHPIRGRLIYARLRVQQLSRN